MSTFDEAAAEGRRQFEHDEAERRAKPGSLPGGFALPGGFIRALNVGISKPPPPEPTGPYTLWLDNNLDGWRPQECETLADCFREMHAIGHVGDYRITRDVEVEIREVRQMSGRPQLWKRTDCPACVRDAERRRVGDEMECPGHPTANDQTEFLRADPRTAQP